MTDPQRIPTNLRTLLILEVVGNSDRPLTPTEINQKIGLPKQTVHRLCTTLEKEGFLTRAEDPKRLRPGRRLREIAAGLLHGDAQHMIRHQILRRVSAQVEETVNFVVAQDAGMQYVDRVETDWPLRIQLPIGSAVPFHCTASGKVFLSAMRTKARERFVETLTLSIQTPNTHVTPDGLLGELVQISKQGFATDNEEFMQGMVAVAVPVTDQRGRFVAALACHGPTQRMTLRQAVGKKDILAKAAAEISEALFN